jgi:hypothetical protein
MPGMADDYRETRDGQASSMMHDTDFQGGGKDGRVSSYHPPHHQPCIGSMATDLDIWGKYLHFEEASDPESVHTEMPITWKGFFDQTRNR